MEKERKEQLLKLLKKVKIADRCRLAFLFVALLSVLFIFYGDKFAMEAAWYQDGRAIICIVLFFAVLFMLISSIVKIVIVTVYNRIVKKQ